ncbi:aldo/keto reductase [Selenomonas sp. F0473]|uniref:aldo/keto reductase n=1 Tax=Selenomonas sp. F0473 TaxID=999423 RepID=UPI00029E5D1D|nr:aldo/keto reductase [Selenomonas sp. F0473]EKU71226.1 hypothetical protein HMPREF9161_01320 [Selenomonas sp. F0473]
MEYTKLGTSGLKVSRICLGCMGFGDAACGQHSWTVDETETRAIIKHALDRGVNFFDTAIAYQSGTSERYVGRALRDFARREKVVLATKFLPRTQEDIAAGISGQEHIRRMIEGSLTNLGMDYVDLYIYHMWDYNTPMEEIMEGLNAAVHAGKTRYIGIANAFAWQVAEMNALARDRGWAEFVSVQNHWNLIFREEEREMLPYCRERHLATTPYSALASGRLSRRPGETSKRLAEDSYARFKYDATADEDARIVDRVRELSDRHGVPMTVISLAWLLTKATAPIVGATKTRHIDAPAAAVDFKLTADEIAYLEEPYVPHPLSGVMAQNRPETAREKKVWSVGKQRL